MWWTTSIPGLLALIELEKAEEAKRAKAVWLNAFDVKDEAAGLKRRPRLLVACEYSAKVRDAFTAKGWHAVSCDLLPSESPGNHYQGDVRDLLGEPWDLMIAHPPCTRLTNAGARWWKGREAEQAEALDFVRLLMSADIPRIAIENPPGKIGSAIRPADQYIQPWQFGHPETKRTGLWLKGLPRLRPTNDVHAQMMTLPLAQRSRVHWMPPSDDRWKERSRTYPGIAAAMADQWGTAHGCNVEPAAPDGQALLQLPINNAMDERMDSVDVNTGEANAD